MRLCLYLFYLLNMPDTNKSKKTLAVTTGILIFSFIVAQSWVSETLGYNFADRHGRFVTFFSDAPECTTPHTMHALLDDLSLLSVQLTVHEEQDGVIISDPIEGLIKELQQVYGRDLCTDFINLSQEQQLLYIEIEKLLFDLKGLEIKALNTEEKERLNMPVLS